MRSGQLRLSRRGPSVHPWAPIRPSAGPSPDDVPGQTSGPAEGPQDESIPAPIIVAKVNDKGTGSPRDDSLLRGAAFAIHADDGDGIFEAGSDGVVWDGTADSGFLVFPAAPEGDYWVIETDAPTGFHTAPPTLVHHEPDRGAPGLPGREGTTELRA